MANPDQKTLVTREEGEAAWDSSAPGGGGTPMNINQRATENSRNVADMFWNDYGNSAIPMYQGMGTQAQAGLDALAASSSGYGNTYANSLANTGVQYGNQIAQAGAADSRALAQSGQQFAGQLGTLGNQAAVTGLGYGAGAQQIGAQQSQGLAQQAALLNQQAAAAQGRAPIQGDFAAQNQALYDSQRQANALTGIESQQGPSAAQAQLQSALNQSQQANLAMARSGRGFGGSAAATRQASAQNATAGQQAANASAMLRAQEDAAFRQRQAANIGAAAGIQQGAGAQFGNQAGAQMQASLQQQQQNDAFTSALYGQGAGLMGQGANVALQGQTSAAQIAQNAYQQQLAAYGQAAQTSLGAQQAAGAMNLGALETAGGMQMQGYGQGANVQLAGLNQAGNQYMQGFGANMAAQQAAGQVFGAGIQNEQQVTSNMLSGAAIDAGISAQQQQNQNNLLAAGLGAGGALVGSLIAPGAGTVAGGAIGAAAGKEISDERAKTDIAPATLDLLEKAPGFTYRYKDPAHGEGKFLGPMAQDLEKSEIGASMVSTGPDGLKMVDSGRAGLAALGGLSVLKREFESKVDKLRAEIESLGKRKGRKAA